MHIIHQDWDYMWCSDYHRQVVFRHGCGAVSLESTDTSGCEESLSSTPALHLDPSAPLFPHIPALFYVLHLLYEELKLDELQRSGGRSLVGLLQQLARYWCSVFTI
jgi:anaphase-promoting complex subunit 1